MTDTSALELEIKKSGKKKTYLAMKCGLSLTGFRNCCTNRAEFKASQIKTLCEELDIKDLTRKEEIFFTHKGA